MKADLHESEQFEQPMVNAKFNNVEATKKTSNFDTFDQQKNLDSKGHLEQSSGLEGMINRRVTFHDSVPDDDESQDRRRSTKRKTIQDEILEENSENTSMRKSRKSTEFQYDQEDRRQPFLNFTPMGYDKLEKDRSKENSVSGSKTMTDMNQECEDESNLDDGEIIQEERKSQKLTKTKSNPSFGKKQKSVKEKLKQAHNLSFKDINGRDLDKENPKSKFLGEDLMDSNERENRTIGLTSNTLKTENIEMDPTGTEIIDTEMSKSNRKSKTSTGKRGTLLIDNEDNQVETELINTEITPVPRDKDAYDKDQLEESLVNPDGDKFLHKDRMNRTSVEKGDDFDTFKKDSQIQDTKIDYKPNLLLSTEPMGKNANKLRDTSIKQSNIKLSKETEPNSIGNQLSNPKYESYSTDPKDEDQIRNSKG